MIVTRSITTYLRRHRDDRAAPIQSASFILVRWEFYPKNFLGVVQLACLVILCKRF